MTTMHERVAMRFVIAKSMSLIPEYKAAILAYERGDEGPIVALIKKVADVILPNGGNVPPSWFMALGVAKRNTLKYLVQDADRLLTIISPSNPGYAHDPDKWRRYVVMQLEPWGKKLRTLELASQATDEDREFKHGDFMVTPMPGVTKAETDGALEALDAAASKVRAKFPEVLYGKVFFSTHLSAKTSAHYVHADDTVHLSVRARKRFSDIYTLIHELGHRYDHQKFLKSDFRKEFWALSTRREFEKVVFDEKLRDTIATEAVEIAKARKAKKPFRGMSPELEMWASEPMNTRWVKDVMTDFLNGHTDEATLHKQMKGNRDVTITTDKLLHGPLSVTPYGATKPTENFAEAFAHYVLDMPMPQQFVELFAKYT